MNSKTIVYIVVALIVVVGVFFLLSKKGSAPTAPAGSPDGAGNTSGLGADIYDQVAPEAAGAIPETNPFKAVQTNPFN